MKRYWLMWALRGVVQAAVVGALVGAAYAYGRERGRG